MVYTLRQTYLNLKVRRSKCSNMCRRSRSSFCRGLEEILERQAYSGHLQTLYESGNEGCNATLNLITFSCDMRQPSFSHQLFLTSRRSFLITFTTKSYLHSETHTVHNFYTLYLQTTAL